MAKTAKVGFSHSAIEETQNLINTPCATVQEEKKCEVEFPGHRKVKAAIETHLAIVCENQTDSFLPCQNCTAQHLQTRWRRTSMGKLPPDRVRQPTPEQRPLLPGMPPAPAGDTEVAHGSESKVCHQHMSIYILLFSALHFLIWMNIPRIECAIMIFFQICWLMVYHPLVSALSAAWKCSWHSFCRWQQTIERTCKWRLALIERNQIFDWIIIYN